MIVASFVKFLIVCWVLSAIIAGVEQGLADYNNVP